MEFEVIRFMSSVFDLLKIFFQIHLRIKQSVFVNVFLVLDFLVIGKLGHNFLMLFFQLFYLFIVFLFCSSFFQIAACFNSLIVILVKMLFQIAFCLGDQF